MVELSSALEARMRTLRLVVFDFDGVFTDNAVYLSQDGTESVRCWRGDAFGLRMLEEARIATLVISTEVNPVVDARCRKIKIRCIQGCEDKRAALEQVVAEMGITLNEVAFMGNDINDLPCLTCVGLPIVVRDAHPDVVPHAHYQTKTPGGYGAVREVCELIAAAVRHVAVQ